MRVVRRPPKVRGQVVQDILYPARTRPCSARGCDNMAWGKDWMCRRHWMLVSWSLKEKIWKHHPRTLARMPSRLWVGLMSQAIRQVERKERMLS